MIRRAMARMGDAIGKIKGSSEQTTMNTASASVELFAQAEELSEMVSVLVGIVKGASAAESRVSRPRRKSFPSMIPN